MKNSCIKFIAAALLLCVAHFEVHAQINLIQTFQPDNTLSGVVCLEKSGDKYYVLDQANHMFTLYNSDFSVFKTVSYPSGTNVGIWFVSETLFDLDSTDIEFLYEEYENPRYVMVLDEAGDTLLYRPNALVSNSNVHGPYAGARTSQRGVVNIDSGAILTVVPQGSTDLEVYSLPGQVKPCKCFCSADNGNTSGRPERDPSANDEGLIYPNPVRSGMTVKYRMPNDFQNGVLVFYDVNGVRVLRSDLRTRTTPITLTESSFPAGTYFYQFEQEGKAIGAKKLIVIR